MLRSLSLIFLLLPLFAACNAGSPEEDPTSQTSDLETAYFASGCFWCVEHIYENVKGVEEAVSGFAGGKVKDPDYREVASGRTNHAEAVRVHYDPEQVSFRTLVKAFYASQDPTTQGQAPDFGSQYRSIIFYTDDRQKQIAEQARDSVESSGEYSEPVVTEISPLKGFYPASEHHQDYVRKNPNDRYVQQVSVPRFERFREKMPEVLK